MAWDPPVACDHPYIQQLRADSFPIDDTDLLGRSLAALFKYDVVGTPAYVWECYDRLCRLMGWEGRIEPQSRNTGDAQKALSRLLEMRPHQFDALLDMNRVDWHLYEVAKHMARAAAVPALLE